MYTKAVKNVWDIGAAQTWVCVFLTLSLFALPLSSTAKSIFIVISLALIVFLPIYRKDLLSMFSQSWCWAALLLFFVSVAACVWSPAATGEKLREIEKYSKLLYLPILTVGFRDSLTRQLAFHGFLLAMLITVVASVLMFAGIWTFNCAEASGIFRNHIITSYMMAFAVFLSGFLFLQQTGKARIPYALLSLVFAGHILFINNGRMGYIIFLLLTGLLIIQSFPWRQVLRYFVPGLFLMGMVFFISPVMQESIHHAVYEYKSYMTTNKNTSIGFRLQFYEYAHDLFRRHPWVGNGTASFKHLYHLENPNPPPGTPAEHLQEPHSQYWLLASEWGILGGFAFLFFIGSLFVSSLKLVTLRPLALAVLLSFLVGSLSDSLLFYSGTGYFFILCMALCLGEQGRNDV
jgi:O-antigen ligase